MKTLLAIFLLIAYTATSFGVTLNYHYCSGQLDHVSLLNFSDKDACSCSPGTMPKSCCQDKVVYHKTDNHKNLPDYTFNKTAFSYHLLSTTDQLDYNLRSVNADSNYTNYHVRHSRPLAIYLAIRSIRI